MSIIVPATVPSAASAPFSSAAITRVFQKSQPTATLPVDLSADLGANETIVALNAVSVSPQTAVTIVPLGAPALTSQGFTLNVTGGDVNVTYGMLYSVSTSSGRVLNVTLAVTTTGDETVPNYTTNLSALPALQGSLKSGDSGVSRCMFVLPVGATTSQAYGIWELLDIQGRVYATGNSIETRVEASQFTTIVELTGVIHVPTSVPPTMADQSYQIRWTLMVNGAPSGYLFESLEVLPDVVVPMGAPDLVEVQGDIAQLSLVLPASYQQVTVQVFNGNTSASTLTVVTNPTRVHSGWFYKRPLDTTSLTARLDAYSVMWKATQSAVTPPERVHSRLFVVNPSILQAMADMQSFVMKHRTQLSVNTDLMFGPDQVISWLRRGRDFFNSAGGIPTLFDMTDATGSVRELWLRYAEVGALRAQYLAEGEKSFNFSGSEITLDVDHAQYYESLASSLESSANELTRDLKKGLAINGINGGTGNVNEMGIGSGQAVGVVGVSHNAISPRPPCYTNTWRP